MVVGMSGPVALAAPPRPIEARSAGPFLSGGAGFIPRDAPRAQAGVAAAPPALAQPSALAVASATTTTSDPVRQAASRAAEALFSDRAVAVESFYDEGSGRAVYRVADQATGEVLFESPPEELLRFFASSRAASGAPLVALRA